MDPDGWEMVPCGGFLDYHEGDHVGKKSFTAAAATKLCSDSVKFMFNMNHFVFPSSPSRNSRTVIDQQFVPAPHELGSTAVTTDKDIIIPEEDFKGYPDIALKQADEDQISQLFFKKKDENKSADMKMESPTKAFVPPVLSQVDETGKFDTEDKTEAFINDEKTKIGSSRSRNQKENNRLEMKEESESGVDLWKKGFNGMGAICSFGMAAATVCVIVLGSNQSGGNRAKI